MVAWQDQARGMERQFEGRNLSLRIAAGEETLDMLSEIIQAEFMAAESGFPIPQPIGLDQDRLRLLIHSPRGEIRAGAVGNRKGEPLIPQSGIGMQK